MAATGSGSTRLIVLRGNSAAGKSTIAAEIRGYGRWQAIRNERYEGMDATVMRKSL